MTQKLSLLASIALVASSSLYASSNSLEEAFKNGTTSGDIAVYHHTVNNDTSADSSVTSASVGLVYETDSFHGFSAQAGVRANHELAEKEDGDYDGEFENNAVMTLANIKYANDFLAVTAGRQEIDLEWLGDYNDGVTAALTAIPDTTIVLGYVNRQAAIDETESRKFARFEAANGEKTQAYVIDGKYEGLEGFVFNPYFYTADEIANFYGLKADYDNDTFGLTAQYAASSEDAANTEDGNIMNFEARFNAIENLSLALGYVSTDKDGGAGSISALGDNVDPTEELGDYIYGKDAQTMYITAGYEIASAEITALYASNETENKDNSELNVGVTYNFNDNLAASLMYIDVESDTDEDFNKITSSVIYSF